jgi:hypothetical protein
MSLKVKEKEKSMLSQQQDLQDEANKVLEELGLLEVLIDYGSPTIIGSMSLRLMTWRDIDIEVVTETLSKESIGQLVAKLINKSAKRIDFSFMDNTAHDKIGYPQGIYLGIKYFPSNLPTEELNSKSERQWKIDIWFLLPEIAEHSERAQGSMKTEEIRKKLTDETRQIILEIKNIIAKDPRYRKEIFSVDIYNAVIEKGVKDLEEFERYYRERKIME